MKLFLDTTDINEIKKFYEIGSVDGVTTNPSLLSSISGDVKGIIKEICNVCKEDPVSLEVISTDFAGMMKEAEDFRSIADNICIKLPLTFDGLKACKELSGMEVMTNVTLCFSSTQALLAAKAGATFISIFIGRLDDLSYNGLDIVRDVKEVYMNYPEISTEILAASVRHPLHVAEVAKIGADIATIPSKVMNQLYKNPLTDIGLQQFMNDWKKRG